MDKFEVILKYLNKNGFRNQRELARETGFSVGAVNGLLKKMVAAGYLYQSERSYEVSGRGNGFLEERRREAQQEKLLMKSGTLKVKTAVILAAGENKTFSCPTGLLQIAGMRVIDYLLRSLREAGIEKIHVVVGAMEEQYREYLQHKNVILWVNSHYKWSGTMASLAIVKDVVKEDFLLVESNLIFEERAIGKVVEAPYSNCLLLAAPSGSGDEAYVELQKDHTIMRISKDIRQLNRIDGEMLGISKISFSLYQKMLSYYEDNTNPWLNYEYVIEYIGRLFSIYGLLEDDLAWALIEDPTMYQRAQEIVYPKIKKKHIAEKERYAKAVLKACLGLDRQSKVNLHIGGGMTNTNFYAAVDQEEYILRIPGACTDEMLNRAGEQHNAALATTLGINPKTIYFNPITGIKITEYIKKAKTLNGKTARLESNIKKITLLLRTLHHSDIRMYGEFSVREEYEKYKHLIQRNKGIYYPDFDQMDRYFYQVQLRLEALGLEYRPCHNDLVAENFVEDEQGRMYLIDWEYAGFYDPAWDLASHLLECGFTDLEEELFLKHYAPAGISPKCQEKILLFKISQDILWSAWTILKEAGGEDFGGYGISRLQHGVRLKQEYEKRYGQI